MQSTLDILNDVPPKKHKLLDQPSWYTARKKLACQDKLCLKSYDLTSPKQGAK